MVVDLSWIDCLVASKLIYQNGEQYEYVNECDVTLPTIQCFVLSGLP